LLVDFNLFALEHDIVSNFGAVAVGGALAAQKSTLKLRIKQSFHWKN